MARESSARLFPVIAATTVVVLACCDLILLGPAMGSLLEGPFSVFGSALPFETQFITDARLPLMGIVVITHLSAAVVARRRFGPAACGVALILSVGLMSFCGRAAYVAIWTLSVGARTPQ